MQRKRIDISAYRMILQNNTVYKDIHKGERCFILCSGPSINELDLKKLKNEKSISCSRHHQHPDYAIYAPQYHCVPQVTTQHNINEDLALRLFEETDQCIGKAILFAHTDDYAFIQKKGLFSGRTVRYVHAHLGEDELGMYVPDLTKTVYSITSVPIMALQIALYMGFSSIILLGVEHDSFITNKYEYFYENNIMAGKDFCVNADATMNRQGFPRSMEFSALSTLWRQYEYLHSYAQTQGTVIVNATPNTALDVFPRVLYDDLF
jgi:hypothetical protein